MIKPIHCHKTSIIKINLMLKSMLSYIGHATADKGLIESKVNHYQYPTVISEQSRLITGRN